MRWAPVLGGLLNYTHVRCEHAGVLAAGSAAGKTALQGHSAIYSGGYATNLRDITSGTNGTCGTDCTAGSGYDLVTGLGSPVNYP